MACQAVFEDPTRLSLLAYTQMGHCQKKQEKLAQAIESYTKALELDPHSAELSGLLGKLYYLLGNNTLALEFMAFAI